MQEPWFFDSHAHYNVKRFQEDQTELLASMAEHNIGLIMNVGCDLTSSIQSIRLAEQYDFIYASVGSHPDDADHVDAGLVEMYRSLASHPKVVAIGEIGLDYYWEQNPPKEFQQKVFRDHLALARELNLPVIVHDREAHADTLAIVKEFPDLRGVFHCFSGSVEMARELWKMGWYVGFDGPLTYKNAKKVVEVAKEAPLDLILLETDAPYLAPVPYRSKTNHSAMLYLVAEKIAEIRGTTTEHILKLTFENAKRLFNV